MTLNVNKNEVIVEDGCTVAAAVFAAGCDGFHRSVSGEVRGPLCGMGVCFECRVTIDGIRLSRSCNILAADGMEVMTDE
ncbi:MAG: (2Fe-2S)-binding protein [Acidobacteria bacterium]|nr:(2Fe-2S)-binding protein [Acidobacteriota bacterium]